ncbi:unnamed protein product [Nesidiocoris tenuis]|uniref:PAN2 UCH domain-containing protein n=1 Tax=Nesidiocoris tenuis TaxID=355587 RepID=A0A6H5FSW5_9HEMI|nr:unnamed protein product [Nesidiocoris tenuis]CAA9998423.1 unnamed protein product [Nesidiocoris tenuis]
MLCSGAPCHSGNLLRALRSAKEASALRLIVSDNTILDANLLQLVQVSFSECPPIGPGFCGDRSSAESSLLVCRAGIDSYCIKCTPSFWNASVKRPRRRLSSTETPISRVSRFRTSGREKSSRSLRDKKYWKEQMDAAVMKAVQNSEAKQPQLVKVCRYGVACTRAGCRFKHPNQTNGEEPPEIEGELIIYDLYAVICHINDEKKNIVAIINVDPEHPSWFIFNDFR